MRDCQASTDLWDRPDRTEPTLATEQIERTEASDPAEPIDKIEPADPTDRIEPDEPIDKIEPAEPIDRMDPLEPMLRIEPSDAVTSRVMSAIRMSHCRIRDRGATGGADASGLSVPRASAASVADGNLRPKETLVSGYDVRMVVLSTDDLDESIRFYSEVLGIPVKFRDGAHFAALDGGSVTIALATAVDHPMPGKVVVGIKTADVDGAAQAVEASGGGIVKGPYNDAHERRAVVYDNQGNGLVFYTPLAR